MEFTTCRQANSQTCLGLEICMIHLRSAAKLRPHQLKARMQLFWARLMVAAPLSYPVSSIRHFPWQYSDALQVVQATMTTLHKWRIVN
jgi:hypothetical protein